MATFVHLTPEKNLRSIRRVGIRGTRYEPGEPAFVYAVPTTPNFVVSHQWLRELKRRGDRTLCAVYFRIPDEEIVWAGRYNESHEEIPAGEAVARLFRVNEAAGYQVVIPRSIEPEEIHRIRPVPQVLGWRYSPEARGRPPCGCPACLPRGEIKGRRLRQRWLDAQ